MELVRSVYLFLQNVFTGSGGNEVACTSVDRINHSTRDSPLGLKKSQESQPSLTHLKELAGHVQEKNNDQKRESCRTNQGIEHPLQGESHWFSTRNWREEDSVSVK